MAAPDYYKILGVEPAAHFSDIRRAYRKLVLQYHPDHNPGKANAEEKIKEINGAYDILKNPAKRRAYDLARGAGQPAQPKSESQTYSQPAPTPSWGRDFRFSEEIKDFVFDSVYDFLYFVPLSRLTLIFLLVLPLINRAYFILFPEVFGVPFSTNSRAGTVIPTSWTSSSLHLGHFFFFYYWLLFECAWHWLFLGITLGILALCFTRYRKGAVAFFFGLQFLLCILLLVSPQLFTGFVLFYEPLFTIDPLKPIL